MGGSSYDDDAYKARSSVRAHAPVAQVFSSHSAAAAMDAGLNPLNVKFREARDSAAHPESNAICVFFDVTGSMGDIPVMFAKEKLGSLMRILLGQGAIADPQILFGAVGDAYSDRAPLQVAQFESGLEMDDWLTKIFLEGNGGGQERESYELPIYWATHHVAMDCLEKRGKKGFLFVIGDESYYPKLRSDQVKQLIGDDVQDTPIEKVIADAQEKFEVFKICVASGQYRDGHHGEWKKVLGERAVYLEKAETICEFIAAQIAACEGVTDIDGGLKAAGVDPHTTALVSRAVVRGTGGGALQRGTVTGDLQPVSGAGKTDRL